MEIKKEKKRKKECKKRRRKRGKNDTGSRTDGLTFPIHPQGPLSMSALGRASATVWNTERGHIFTEHKVTSKGQSLDGVQPEAGFRFLPFLFQENQIMIKI